jgi:hypothetical protein
MVKMSCVTAWVIRSTNMLAPAMPPDAVFPRGAGPTLRDCISLRFVREGINTLLPVAQASAGEARRW